MLQELCQAYKLAEHLLPGRRKSDKSEGMGEGTGVGLDGMPGRCCRKDPCLLREI